MNGTAEVGSLLGSNPRRKYRALLHDITIVNPRFSSNLLTDKTARETGKHLADSAVERKSKSRGLFPASFSFLALTVSTLQGEVDSDEHPLKDLATTRVENRLEASS